MKKMIIGGLAALAVGLSLTGCSTTGGKPVAVTTTTAAAPTTTTKSPAVLQREQAAVEAARAAETTRMDPTAYEVISPRDYAILVKNPDAAKGRKLVVYGYVTQFDERPAPPDFGRAQPSRKAATGTTTTSTQSW